MSGSNRPQPSDKPPQMPPDSSVSHTVANISFQNKLIWLLKCIVLQKEFINQLFKKEQTQRSKTIKSPQNASEIIKTTKPGSKERIEAESMLLEFASLAVRNDFAGDYAKTRCDEVLARIQLDENAKAMFDEWNPTAKEKIEPYIERMDMVIEILLKHQEEEGKEGEGETQQQAEAPSTYTASWYVMMMKLKNASLPNQDGGDKTDAAE
jgi:hypothetical protein